MEITTKGDESGLYLDFSAGSYKVEIIERYGELIKVIVQNLLGCPDLRVKELLLNDLKPGNRIIYGDGCMPILMAHSVEIDCKIFCGKD